MSMAWLAARSSKFRSQRAHYESCPSLEGHGSENIGSPSSSENLLVPPDFSAFPVGSQTSTIAPEHMVRWGLAGPVVWGVGGTAYTP
jgi:hypothetical protein